MKYLKCEKKNLNFFNDYRLLPYEAVWFVKSVDFVTRLRENCCFCLQRGGWILLNL